MSFLGLLRPKTLRNNARKRSGTLNDQKYCQKSRSQYVNFSKLKDQRYLIRLTFEFLIADSNSTESRLLLAFNSHTPKLHN